MEKEQDKKLMEAEAAKENAEEISETWAQECIEDIDDWIESQGIYLRQ